MKIVEIFLAAFQHTRACTFGLVCRLNVQAVLVNVGEDQ